MSDGKTVKLSMDTVERRAGRSGLAVQALQDVDHRSIAPGSKDGYHILEVSSNLARLTQTEGRYTRSARLDRQGRS